jgi:polysaccharide export outer membrane protein
MKGRIVWWMLVGLLVARPVPAEDAYRIGGGDALAVNVWKNAELSQSVVVRPDGRITLPLIHDVRAEGLTAMELGTVLAERLAAFVNAPNVTVTVAAPTSFRVYTEGAIANGVHLLAAPITARQLLASAGGATPEADLSRAYILRGDERLPVDLSTGARNEGSPRVNPLLAPGDTLTIPVRDATLGRVLVVGEVSRPRALPYAEGMTFLDAYLDAGGGTTAADLAHVKIARRSDGGDTSEIPIDADELLNRGALRNNVALAPGDTVIVPSRPPQERILVVGEVRTPAILAFREGLTVLDAYVQAGGGTEYADLDSVKVVRAGAGRKREELGVDLERILKKADVSRNVPLLPGDIVMVPR